MSKSQIFFITLTLIIGLSTGCNRSEKYNLNVDSGKGTGKYTAGKQVSVKAEPNRKDSVFTHWTGGAGYISNVYSPSTSVLIPAKDIRLKPVYRAKWSCGIADLDRIRKQVKEEATQPDNARSHHAALSRWWRLMWRQGYNMSAFDETASILVSIRDYTPEVTRTIDRGFAILEKLHANPVFIKEVKGEAPENHTTPATDWPFYHGIDGAQTGYSPDPGPSEGKISWRFPKPYKSNACPVVSNGKVFLSSPGIDVIGYCLDEESGKVIWKARQYGTEFYGTPKSRVSPHLASDRVLIRTGALERNFYLLDRETGQRLKPAEKHTYNGHGNLAVYKVYEGFFALTDVTNGRVIRYYDTGKELAGEPLLLGKTIYVTHTDGGVSAYLIDEESPAWKRELDVVFRNGPSAGKSQIYVSSPNGTLFALDIVNGKTNWTFQANNLAGNAFRFYSNAEEADDRLYIGTANSTLLCLHASNGDLIWKHEVSDWIRSKPLVVSNMVYAATVDGKLYAIRDNGTAPVEEMSTRLNEHGFTADLTGNENSILAAGRDLILYSVSPETFYPKWRHGILDGTWIDGQFYRAGWTSGLQPSPTVSKGILYCGGIDGFVHALDAENGKEIWRFETGGTVGAAITVAEDKVFFGEISGKGEYYALDKKTGKLLWQTQEYGNVWVGAAYSNGKLFFGNMDGMMFGVDPENGNRLWTYDTSKDTPKENWRNLNKQGHGWPPGIYPVPVSDATKVYVGSWSGYYFAFDQKTGELVWRTQTNEGNLEGGLPDSAAPVLWGDYVYVQKNGHILAALNRETGHVEWEWKTPNNFLQNGTVAAHDNKIFASFVNAVTRIPYNSTVIAFNDVENGSSELWTYKGGAGLTAPVITDDKLITGSSADPFMVCLDPDTGNVMWRTFTGGEMLENVPAIYGNKIYAHFNNGWLYAIE